jgi:hypothetical protein
MARPMLHAAAFVCLLPALLPAVASAKSRAANARAAVLACSNKTIAGDRSSPIGDLVVPVEWAVDAP